MECRRFMYPMGRLTELTEDPCQAPWTSRISAITDPNRARAA